MKTYYEVLGVSLTTEASVIKAHFNDLAIELHPDTHKGTEDQFKEVTEAWNTLKDDKRRQQYNRTLALAYDNCMACKGRGLRAKTTGFTTKKLIPCTNCKGSGLIRKGSKNVDW